MGYPIFNQLYRQYHQRTGLFWKNLNRRIIKTNTLELSRELDNVDFIQLEEDLEPLKNQMVAIIQTPDATVVGMTGLLHSFL